MSDIPIAKRSANMWYDDLLASVELLSEPADAQLAAMRQWQLNSAELRKRFQLEWTEFRKLHVEPLPLRVAERLDWLAQLIAGLSSQSDPSHHEWDEIRATARDIISSMKSM